jgi:threonine-phosphate decarboxylase
MNQVPTVDRRGFFHMRKLVRPYDDPTPLFRHGGRRADQRHMLDFSASINPLGPPKSVLRVLRDGLGEIAYYPDPECRELTEKIAAYHHVDPDMIVVGNGSNELIYAIARAFRPKRVAIAEPTYTEYLRASLLVGAEVDHWLAEGDQFLLRPFDPEMANLLWLCNPNNPTGLFWTDDNHFAGASSHVGAWVRNYPQTLFVVDEAFMPFCDEEKRATLVPHLDGLANLIILRSLTKYFALPGLRLGYALTNPDRARCIRKQLALWSVNVLAQLAGIAALEDRGYAEQTATALPNMVNFFRHGLAARSDWAQVSLLPSASIFVLAHLKKETAAELTARLLERGIRIRDASNFVGLDAHHIRLSIRNEHDCAQLLRAWPLSRVG